MIKYMPLNLQSINYNINFEFYLNDKVFYLYSLNVNEIEVSLKDLCYYLSNSILKKYQYHKFTGSTYEYLTILDYKMEIQQKMEVKCQEQTKKVATQFPLNVQDPEQVFSNNLYFNILLNCQANLDPTSFINEFANAPLVLLRISPNIFWKNFLQHKLDLFIDANDFIRSIKCDIRATNKLNYQKLGYILETISTNVSVIQDNYKNVQYCYDEISVVFFKMIRLIEKMPNFSIEKQLDNTVKILFRDIADVFRFYEGSFGSLSQEQHCILNTYFVLSILNIQNKEVMTSKNYLKKMQLYVEEMKQCRDILIYNLYQVQREAITSWNQSQDRN